VQIIDDIEAIDIERISTRRNLMQSAKWARTKRRRGRDVRAFRLRGRLGAGAAVVVLQRLSDAYRMAYLPWGPDLTAPPEQQGLVLEESAEALRAQLPEDVLFLRFDLPWRSPFDVEAAEEGVDPQDRGAPVSLPPAWVRSMRLNFGTAEHNLRKAPTDMQPTDTVLIDLTESEERILARMRGKTRYNIRLAGRRNVVVREEGLAALPEWQELYRRTMERAGTHLHDPEHFESILRTPDDRETGVHLLTARVEGRAVAGLILAVSGDYAVYLYGASGDEERRRMPTYLLQWEAMTLARARGARVYDMFGIPSDPSPAHPMHGLLRFKTGFGGSIVTRRGCWDYPLEPVAYEQLVGQESAAPGYHR
jgi:lipid II:glycine glycyltransferase (peptidoglycan interpeptide bridge formation enzyme)